MLNRNLLRALLAGATVTCLALPLAAQEKTEGKPPAEKPAAAAEKAGEKALEKAGEKPPMPAVKAPNGMRGTVKSFDAASKKLVVETKSKGAAKEQEFTLGDKVTVKGPGKPGEAPEAKTLADLHAGDNLWLTLSADKTSVESIRILPAPKMGKKNAESKKEVKAAIDEAKKEGKAAKEAAKEEAKKATEEKPADKPK